MHTILGPDRPVPSTVVPEDTRLPADGSFESLLRQPLDAVLRSGGDHRQVLQPETGLNSYRVAARPRDGVPLGSCTASWPSDLAWSVAGETFARWQSLGDGLLSEMEDHAADIRRRLAEAFELRREAKVVLTPSGTDAVFVVSSLALARGATKVHHIVVGAAELGSGTLGAARGDAFTEHRPVGPKQSFAAGLDGLSEVCTAQPVYLRDGDGRALPLGYVDEAVTEAADDAVADGATVVVHMVVHSKTGLRAPSLRAVLDLRDRHGERVHVLVDAAQGRVSPVDLRRAIDHGLIVLFTGSKFYSGPPFSGALLVPAGIAEDPGPLPVGLNQWLARADLPRSWPRARAGLTQPANPGLLLRWDAALAEIEHYHQLSIEERSRVYLTFGAAMVHAFDPSDRIDLLLPGPPVHELASSLGVFPSVYSLRIRDASGSVLALDELRDLHVRLDSDPGHGDEVDRTRFHLGQAVGLGPPSPDRRGVLRVALGARLVRELAATDDAGDRFFRETMEALRTKIERATA